MNWQFLRCHAVSLSQLYQSHPEIGWKPIQGGAITIRLPDDAETLDKECRINMEKSAARENERKDQEMLTNQQELSPVYLIQSNQEFVEAGFVPST